MLWGHKAPLCPSLPDALVADSASPVVNRPPLDQGDGAGHPTRRAQVPGLLLTGVTKRRKPTLAHSRAKWISRLL